MGVDLVEFHFIVNGGALAARRRRVGGAATRGGADIGAAFASVRRRRGDLRRSICGGINVNTCVATLISYV